MDFFGKGFSLYYTKFIPYDYLFVYLFFDRMFIVCFM